MMGEEGSLKRTYLLAGTLMVALVIFGCSSSGPETSNTYITDDNPVTGQRILLQVIAETDNPPMQYIWDCPNGLLEDASGVVQSGVATNDYYVYWIPQGEGTYTITCTVIDGEDKQDTIPFTVTVSPRQLITVWTPPDDQHGVFRLTKDYYIKAGGIWAAISNNNLYYFCSTGDTDLSWGADFFDWGTSDPPPLSALAAAAYASYYYVWSNIWTIRNNAGTWQMVVYSVGDEYTYDCPSETCGSITTVNTMGIYNGILWIGTDKGLFTFGTSSTEWNGPVEYSAGLDIPAVKDIYAANDLVYAATTGGIWYTPDGGDTWSFFNTPYDTTAITGYKNPATDVISIYARTDSDAGYVIKKFSEDGLTSTDLATQPPTDTWTRGLDSDNLGRIWFGKYYYWEVSRGGDGSWKSVDNSGDHIVRSLISPEGLAYLQTSTGALKVWGKYEDND